MCKLGYKMVNVGGGRLAGGGRTGKKIRNSFLSNYLS
jgi:hypothetical protein